MVWQYTSWKSWLWATACVIGMALVGQEARAQTDSAPFVFLGETLRIDTPNWESHGDFVVAEQANIDVQQGINAHIGGPIGPEAGSRNGLTKLGGGTLRLSGPATYRGVTRLLQGGLHIDGPSVFSSVGAIEAIRGTQLQYTAGVDMNRPLTLHLQEIQDILPLGEYTPVAPWPGLNDEVGWRVDSGYAAHSGLLQGSAPFVKLGDGTLDIAFDAMGYTGRARVAEGALGIQDIFLGSVQVQSGARTFGQGMISSVHVERDAVLAPGRDSTTIGALSVLGEARFDAGSRFEIKASETGLADYLWVGGKAWLDGQVAVLAQEGLWAADASYPILRAEEGLSDTRFASVTSNLAYLTPELSYDAHTVTLDLARNDVPIGEPGETPDEKEVGDIVDEPAPRNPKPSPKPRPKRPPPKTDDAAEDAPDLPEPQLEDEAEAELDAVPGAVPGVVPGVVPEAELPIESPSEAEPVAHEKANPDLYDRVVVLDPDQARRALQQLTGSWNASVQSAVWDDSRFVREAALRHTAGDETFFVDAFHSELTREQAERLEAHKRRIQGFIVGAADALHRHWRAGGFIGVQRAEHDGHNGLTRAMVDTVNLGAFAVANLEALLWVAGAVHSWHHVKTHRGVEAGTLNDGLDATYRGNTTQLFGELTWRIRQGLAPFVRAAWIRSEFDGFTESGGSAALKVQAATLNGWVGSLGLRAEATVADPKLGSDAAKVFLHTAWNHARYSAVASRQNFRDSLTQTPFTSHGLAPPRNSWSLHLGLDGRVSKRVGLGIGYLGHFSRGTQDHGVGGWARVHF